MLCINIRFEYALLYPHWNPGGFHLDSNWIPNRREPKRTEENRIEPNRTEAPERGAPLPTGAFGGGGEKIQPYETIPTRRPLCPGAILSAMCVPHRRGRRLDVPIVPHSAMCVSIHHVRPHFPVFHPDPPGASGTPHPPCASLTVGDGASTSRFSRIPPGFI